MAILQKTLVNTRFENIFSEISHEEKLGLINPHHLRLFQLNVVDNAFTFDALKNFLLINIGQYIYSRERIKKFINENEITLIGLKAVELLRNRCNGDFSWLGDELGDLMLYVFLEQILDAPKVFSKFDLPTDGHIVPGCSGVHLLQPDTSLPSYQMVFGKSRIDGDPRDAIDTAFVTLEAIKNDTFREMKFVESTAFDKHFEPSVAEHLKNLIIPTKGQTFTHDTAFGVFLGYSLGLAANNKSSTQFRTELADKMRLDIKNHVTYIIDKIKATKMERYSFYFYFLPFNEADSEKHRVMMSLIGLNGGM